MDANTGRVLGEVAVGVEPEGMAVSPDDKYTVATSESTSMAHVIDNASMKLIANVLVDTRPREAKFTRDGKPGLGVVGGRRHRLGDRHQDVENHQEDRLCRARCAAGAIAAGRHQVSKDGKCLLWRSDPANRVAVIDTKTYAVKQYILVGQRPWHMGWPPTAAKLYVANGLTNDMTVIDVGTLKAEKSVPVGRLPWGVAVVP